MDNALGRLLEWFSEFTWRRFFALIVVSAIFLACFSLFERYTSSFRLTRLQKASELLVKVSEMEKYVENGSPEIKRASKELIKQTIEAIETKPLSLDYLPNTLTFSMDYLWKILAGSAFWLLLAITNIPKIIKGDTKARDTSLGILFLAAIAGTFANSIPSIWWPWGHLIFYPVSLLAIITMVFVIPVVLWERKPKKISTEEAPSKGYQSDTEGT